MAQSTDTSISNYLKELSPERGRVVKKVRQCIVGILPPGFVETINWGIISYEVPLIMFPQTYNRKPLQYRALAAKKNHYAIYLMCVYAGSRYLTMLKEGYHSAGIELDMGESCLRFRSLDQLHLPTLKKVIAACSVDNFIRIYQAARS